MKKLLSFIAIALLTLTVSAQTPQGINWQGKLSDASGQLLINTTVQVRFTILQGGPTGTVVYQENHITNTDNIGSVSLVLGDGAALNGTFSAVNWGLGHMFLSIEVNTGNNYVMVGTTQMMSVPYALYAEKAGNAGGGSVENTIYLGKLGYVAASQFITADYLIPSFQEDYDYAGYAVALTPNPTPSNSLTDNEEIGNEFKFNADLFFEIPAGTPVGTTFYIRAWIKKTDGTYVYSTQRTIVTQ